MLETNQNYVSMMSGIEEYTNVTKIVKKIINKLSTGLLVFIAKGRVKSPKKTSSLKIKTVQRDISLIPHLFFIKNISMVYMAFNKLSTYTSIHTPK